METQSPVRKKKASWEEQATALKNILRTDPLNFPRKLLGIPNEWLWDGVEKIFLSVLHHQKTVVQSGHSLSKDYTAGILSLYWLLFYFPRAKVIATAPKLLQVKEIMFEEISKQFHALRQHSPWPIKEECLQTLKLELSDECYAIGFTTKEAKGMMGKFQGFKSPNLLIVITEAQAVEDSIFDQIIGLTAGSNYRILEIGNPMAPIGRFWEHCTKPSFGYNIIKMSAFDSPNVKAGRVVIPGVVTREFISEIETNWGREHPYWFSRVLGEFPQSSKERIIPMEWIMRAVEKEFQENDALRVGGLDVSKMGADETVHVVLEGKKILKIDAFHKVDVNETVGWAKNLILEDKLDAYACDEGGLAGVAGFLEEDERIRCQIIRIQFGGKVESEDFDNLGAAMWWALRSAFQDECISIPNDPILIGQLAARKYEMTSRGKKRIKLESKRDAASRGEESPDRADALAMAWWARINIDETLESEGKNVFEAEMWKEMNRSIEKLPKSESCELVSNQMDY